MTYLYLSIAFILAIGYVLYCAGEDWNAVQRGEA